MWGALGVSLDLVGHISIMQLQLKTLNPNTEQLRLDARAAGIGQISVYMNGQLSQMERMTEK